MELNNLRNNLKLSGIKENKDEITDKVVIETIKENLDIILEPKDIIHTYRIGKKSNENESTNPRPILINFSNYNFGQKVFKAKKELRNIPNKLFINETLNSK